MARKRQWTPEEEEELINFLTDTQVLRQICKLPKIGEKKHSLADCKAKLQSLLKINEKKSGDEEEQQADAPVGKAAKPASAAELGVPLNRCDEIRRYLELFGYDPGHTILQVNLAGKYGHTTPRDFMEQQTALTRQRYGGTVIVVVGRVHDPAVVNLVAKPRRPGKNSAYVGYFSTGSSQSGLAPHEALPLDFVPQTMQYPDEWRQKFSNSRGYLVTMYVPTAFARHKNELLRHLRSAASLKDVRGAWDWIEPLRKYGAERVGRTASPGSGSKRVKASRAKQAEPPTQDADDDEATTQPDSETQQEESLSQQDKSRQPDELPESAGAAFVQAW